MLITRGFGTGSGTGTGENIYVPVCGVDIEADILGSSQIELNQVLPNISGRDTSLIPNVRTKDDSLKTVTSSSVITPNIKASIPKF